MITQPYTIDQLIEYLNIFWEKATGLDYGQEHEVMHCAAIKLAEMRHALTPLATMAQTAIRTKGLDPATECLLVPIKFLDAAATALSAETD